MTFTFKLSRRLAHARLIVAGATVILTGSCAPGQPLEGGLEPPPTEVLAVHVFPDSVDLQPDQFVDFAAIADLPGGGNSAVSVRWDADGGNITTAGRYTAGGTSGVYHVHATHGNGKADTATVIITNPSPPPPTLTGIVVTPSSAALLPSGTQQFSAAGRLSDGSSSAVSVNWSATGGAISGTGLFTAPSTAGTFQVIATQQGGSLSDTSTVTVTVPPPTLVGVSLTPASASLEFGQTRQFTAVGLLSDGSSTSIAITWTATGGTVNSSGLYTAGSAAGSFRVIAQSANGLADTSAVTVSAPTITGITLTPPTASLQSGQTQQFSVVASLSNGGTQNNPAVTWTATGGAINGSGLYTAGATAGTFAVIATASNGRADTSSVTVALPTITAITVTPPSANLSTGQTQQFSASATLSNGGTQTSPAVTWSATGGTVTTGGLYTAGSTAGTFRVIAAASNGRADTSAITISLPTITAITVTPATVSLQSGQTQQFSASATLSTGGTQSNPAVTWTATGGTVTTSGIYTAGNTAGTFRVIAASAAGPADTSTITITATTVTAIVLTPSSTSVAPGGTQQFSVSATLSNGGTQSNPAVTYTATGGSITTGGLYTAGSTTGTFRVIAVQQSGTLADTASILIAAADTSEPVFRSGIDNMVWSDNIDRYYNLQDMQWNVSECGPTLPDGHPATNYGARTEPNNARACDPPYPEYGLTTGRGGTGQALRSYVHADPAHAQQSVAWLAPWQPNGLNYSGRKVVIQYWVRISAGGTPGTYGMKWMEAWFTSSSLSQNRIQWSNEAGTDARPLFHMVLGANPGNPVIRTRQPIGPYWDQFNDGQWHRITHLWVLNSSSSYLNTGGNTSATETYTGTSSRDGRVAMWIDGKKMMDYSQATVGVVPPGGTGVWATQGDVDFIPGVTGSNSVGPLSFLEFPGVFNGSPVAWTLDHDDMQIWAQP
jgi:hypothetical protein